MTKEIILTKGYVAIVDDIDYDFLNKYNWHVTSKDSNFYAVRNGVSTEPTLVKMHNVLLNTSKLVDHINGNGLDNRRCNLREVTRSQNCLNSRKFKNSQFPYKGVRHNPKTNKFEARIQIEGKRRSLGNFNTLEEAAHSYDNYLRQNKIIGKFNFPKEGEIGILTPYPISSRKSRDKIILVGENNPESILTENQVLEILYKYEHTDITQIELSNLYKVKQSTISCIVLNKTWKHILRDPITYKNKTEQSRNRRNNVQITYNGTTKVASAWIEELSITNGNTFYKQLSRNITKDPSELFKKFLIKTAKYA